MIRPCCQCGAYLADIVVTADGRWRDGNPDAHVFCDRWCESDWSADQLADDNADARVQALEDDAR